MSTFEEIQAQRAKYGALTHEVGSTIMGRSIGLFSKKIRAITMAYDESNNNFKAIFFYESALTEAETEAFNDIGALTTADLCFKFNFIDFTIEIAPEGVDLIPKVQNWGWAFNRLE